MNADTHPEEWLVAHRGWPDRYPENSLEGVKAVLEAGARFVEFDVQITADRRPVVIHDDDLTRLTGRGERVTRITLAQLEGIPVATRPGEHAHVPTLESMLDLVGEYPGVTAFVELKRQSIRRHGRKLAVESVLERMRRAPCPTVLLSFKWLAMRLARKMGAPTTGWVFRSWTPLSRWLAAQLQPDYLFVRADRVPGQSSPFWPGRWQWVIYGVDDLAAARELKARGADLVEVDDLPGLLENEPQAHDE
jgi:glycerophosphoryl diester phosphodiesterase